MILTKLLASDGYICINKTILKKWGIYTAIIIGELCSEYNYWYSHNGLDEEGFFFSTLNNLENETTIKRDVQSKVLKQLSELGVIEVKRKNMPARRFIKINEDKLFDFLQDCSENLVNANLENSSTVYDENVNKITTKTQTSLRSERKQDYDENVNYINNNKYNSNKENNILDINISNMCGNTGDDEKLENKNNKKPYKLKTKINNTKKKTKGVVGNIDKQFELIDIYFNNGNTCNHPEIASLIKQHLNQRIKKIGYKNYSDTRWENQLKLLIENSEGDFEYMKEIIQTSILRDYNDLTFPNQKKSLHQFKPILNKNINSFDTAKDNIKTKGVALFSKEEKIDYLENRLATDENGNPIEF